MNNNLINQINNNQNFVKKNGWKANMLISSYDINNFINSNKLEDCHLYSDGKKINTNSKDDIFEKYYSESSILVNKNISNNSKLIQNIQKYFQKQELPIESCSLISTNNLNGYPKFEMGKQNSLFIVFGGYGSFVSDEDTYSFEPGHIVFINKSTDYFLHTISSTIILQINISNKEKEKFDISLATECGKAFSELYQNKILDTMDDYFDYIKKISKKKQEKLTIKDKIALIKGYEQAGFFEKSLDLIQKYNLQKYLPGTMTQNLVNSIEHLNKKEKEKLVLSCLKQDRILFNPNTLMEGYLCSAVSQCVGNDVSTFYDTVNSLLKSGNLKGNWNFTDTKNLFMDFNIGDTRQEIGVPFVHLPLMTYLIEKYNIENLFVEVREDFKVFFEKYFPKIKVISNISNIKTQMPWTTAYEARINLHREQNYKELLIDQMNKNRKMVSDLINKKSNKVGILWFSNDIKRHEKGVPIGVLINTIGNTDKKIEIKSLQYNHPENEIRIFNKYAKNKIKDIFDNDLSATVQDLVEATFDCKAIIGTSNVTLIASAFGIPTLLVTGYTMHHWYVNDDIIPGVEYTEMKYRGDWNHVNEKINRFIDKHFD